MLKLAELGEEVSHVAIAKEMHRVKERHYRRKRFCTNIA
jgi:hypothetical protein